MREILFRGKKEIDGAWLIGELSTAKYGKEKPQIRNEKHLFERVKLETVGQYTGVEDKNGKKIFEGDIVMVYNPDAKDVAIIGYENAAFMVYPHNGKIAKRTLWEYLHSDFAIEVIGNKYDNPDLLVSLEEYTIIKK